MAGSRSRAAGGLRPAESPRAFSWQIVWRPTLQRTTAAAIPGTLVNRAAGGGEREAVTFGHPSGTLRVGAKAGRVDGRWTVTKAIMSRSARVLMEGKVRVPVE